MVNKAIFLYLLGVGTTLVSATESTVTVTTTKTETVTACASSCYSVLTSCTSTVSLTSSTLSTISTETASTAATSTQSSISSGKSSSPSTYSVPSTSLSTYQTSTATASTETPQSTQSTASTASMITDSLVSTQYPSTSTSSGTASTSAETKTSTESHRIICSCWHCIIYCTIFYFCFFLVYDFIFWSRDHFRIPNYNPGTSSSGIIREHDRDDIRVDPYSDCNFYEKLTVSSLEPDLDGDFCRNIFQLYNDGLQYWICYKHFRHFHCRDYIFISYRDWI
ncbi:hypothetical protein ACHAPX_004710 [Trichoderma viride]